MISESPSAEFAPCFLGLSSSVSGIESSLSAQALITFGIGELAGQGRKANEASMATERIRPNPQGKTATDRMGVRFSGVSPIYPSLCNWGFAIDLQEKAAQMKPYFERAGVRLYLGDCRDVLSDLDDRYGVVLTDPPYSSGARRDSERQVRGSMLRSLEDEDWFSHDAMTTYNQHENIIFASNGMPLEMARRDLGSVLTFASVSSERRIHPTEKPVPLIKHLLSAVDPSLLILDPFGGSGSLGEAAINLGRSAVLIEIEEIHAERAARRLELAELPLFAESSGADQFSLSEGSDSLTTA